jgi:hypothetical protein
LAGVLAFAETLYKCEQALRSALEGWLIVKIGHADTLPIIRKINLNVKVSDQMLCRGRNAGYPAPPAQIRTCSFPAYGSYFECMA